MSLIQVMRQILAFSGLNDDRASVNASLFQLDSIVRLGIINTKQLSVQVQIVHDHQLPGDTGQGRLVPARDADRTRIENSGHPEQNEGRKSELRIQESPFEVTSTFRFTSPSVFDIDRQNPLVINTIPLYFIKEGEQRSCNLKLQRPFGPGEFRECNGRLCMMEGKFSRCEPSKPLHFAPYEGRVDALVAPDHASFYQHRGTLVGIFPNMEKRMAELPLGKDSVLFPRDVFGTVYLICVATTRDNNEPYRIRSYFYIATRATEQQTEEM